MFPAGFIKCPIYLSKSERIENGIIPFESNMSNSPLVLENYQCVHSFPNTPDKKLSIIANDHTKQHNDKTKYHTDSDKFQELYCFV